VHVIGFEKAAGQTTQVVENGKCVVVFIRLGMLVLHMRFHSEPWTWASHPITAASGRSDSRSSLLRLRALSCAVWIRFLIFFVGLSRLDVVPCLLVCEAALSRCTSACMPTIHDSGYARSLFVRLHASSLCASFIGSSRVSRCGDQIVACVRFFIFFIFSFFLSLVSCAVVVSSEFRGGPCLVQPVAHRPEHLPFGVRDLFAAQLLGKFVPKRKARENVV
jgi:hypothetical protein